MSIKSMYERFAKSFKKSNNASLSQTGDLKTYIDRIVSDGILLNEIPSPTDFEEDRGGFIKRRLSEFSIDNFDTDEFGNITVLFPGYRYTSDYLLVYTDMDNLKYSASESIVEIKDNKLTGIGIGDNSIGTATLLVLCEYIQKNNVAFEFNLVILFSLRNTPENNYEGINYFFRNWNKRVFSSIYLFGLYQGKLIEKSYGIYNISFVIKSNGNDVLGKNYTDSTVDLAAKLYNKINAIDWNEYNSIVNIVRISSGVGFEYYPAEGSVDIEIFSRDIQSLNSVKAKIVDIGKDLSADKNDIIENKTVSYIPPAIDKLNESLNNIAKKVHKSLVIETKIANIPDYSYIINQFGIPSISLGITTGTKTMNYESVDTKFISNGFKQVLSFLNEINLTYKQEKDNG